ncbi:MAG: T9SS type A sorting domain-containing protein [Bacteroidales bacterium]|nr:T9SS type A sorting domain-containing protein [Bacteroidales bacterium]
MKKTLLFLLVLSVSNLLGQNKNPEHLKSLSESNIKSYIDQYYNPLMDKYDVYFVKLDLEISDLTTDISGNATLQMKTIEELDTLLLDFYSNMLIDSMFIDDKEVIYEHSNNQIQYIFDTPLALENDFKVQVYYHGTPYGFGVFNAYKSDWDTHVTYTLSESFQAREWWPCKQVLSDKIDSAYVFLTCADTCMAGSNGLLKNVVELPNNKKRYEWKTYYPINYYLISFAVADYQDYSIYAHPIGTDSILIQNFIWNNPDYLSENKTGIDNTIDFIELFSEKFGLYPFANEKYGHCLSTIGGGMEHQTMTTIGNLSEYAYDLITHELGHMWFGDYVTCASWQDIWINEGFATYAEYVALENLKSDSSAQEWMNATQTYALEDPNRSIYVPFDEAFDEGRIFNYRISYLKGAAIIHMIRNQINDDELFFTCLQNYLSEYADSVATGDDFKNSIEANTGIDFDPFFNQWYYGKGYPHFDVNYTQHNDTLFMTVSQLTTSTSTPLFQLFVDYKINYTGGDTTLRLCQSHNYETFKIPLKETVTNIVVDPDNWILKIIGTVNSIELPENNITLFSFSPNPVKDILKVYFNANLYSYKKQIQIMDINGRLIKSYIINSDSYPIDVSFLSNGIYFIRGISANKSYTYKFLKQ